MLLCKGSKRPGQRHRVRPCEDRYSLRRRGGTRDVSVELAASRRPRDCALAVRPESKARGGESPIR